MHGLVNTAAVKVISKLRRQFFSDPHLAFRIKGVIQPHQIGLVQNRLTQGHKTRAQSPKHRFKITGFGARLVFIQQPIIKIAILRQGLRLFLTQGDNLFQHR